MRFDSWFVYQKDKRWYVGARYKVDGKWHQKSHKLDARNKTEAKRLAQEWVFEQAQDDAPTAASTPLPEYVAAMNADVAASGSIEPSSVASRDYSLVHIRDGFSGVAISDVTPDMAQAWVSGMKADGLSSSTVKKAYLLASEACQLAVRRGDLVRNPFADVRVPSVTSKPPNALPASERARLVSWLESVEESRLSLAVMLALYGGMREAEICGLRWGDVDLGAGTLWVRRSIGRGQGGAYVKEPKTRKVRDIPLGDTLTRHLSAWLVSYKLECADAGVRFDPARLYVIGAVDGAFYNPTVLSREWRAVSRMMNLTGTEGRRCTFHDLRHTFATAAIAAHVDVKTVSSILGHANAAMTLNVYASADPEAKRSAAPAIDQAVMSREEPRSARVRPDATPRGTAPTQEPDAPL